MFPGIKIVAWGRLNLIETTHPPQYGTNFVSQRPPSIKPVGPSGQYRLELPAGA